MTTVTTTPTASNGVNVAALLGAREALTGAPAAAQFISGFYGLGSEQKHRQPFSFDTDHPEVFASEDLGATPVELVLVGLAGCLTAGIAAVAQNRNIQLNSVKATLEAPMDLRGTLGVDADVRNGFDSIKVHYEIDADASEAAIAALVAQSQKRSAVFDIVTNPTDVTVTTRKA